MEIWAKAPGVERWREGESQGESGLISPDPLCILFWKKTREKISSFVVVSQNKVPIFATAYPKFPGRPFVRTRAHTVVLTLLPFITRA